MWNSLMRDPFLMWSFKKNSFAPGGSRTPDLRITSAPSADSACTAYKYDALTNCATGAWMKESSRDKILLVS